MQYIIKLYFIVILLCNFAFAENNFLISFAKSKPSMNFYNIDSFSFKKTNSPIILRENSNEYWVKVQLVNSNASLNNKVLNVTSLFGVNAIIFDERLINRILDHNTIEINNQETIYFKIKNNRDLIYITTKIEDKITYIENLKSYNKLYGIAYGISFTAFLYYIVLYFYNRKRSFLYYSLTQLFSLLILLFSKDTNYLPYDFVSLGFIVFSTLFTKEFLNTKKHLPKGHLFLNFVIGIFIFDSFFSLEQIFPVAIFLLTFPILAYFIYKKTKDKSIIFYIIAWSMLIISFNIIAIDLFVYQILNSIIDYNDLLHIIIPLESLILAFALSYKIKTLEDLKNEKEKILIQQNKLAALGEMINNIAHQWRQPLTYLSYTFMNIKKSHKLNLLDEKYLDKKITIANTQIKHMSETIDTFKDFYSTKKNKSEVSISNEISNTLTIISASLEENKINVSIEGNDFKIYGFTGDLSQVLLNIFSNAKDAFIERKINTPKIEVSIEKNKILISDNAGGIDKDIENKIYDSNYTTKKAGLGIGLYMSKLIIENHFNGKLYHVLTKTGTTFVIELKEV